MAVTPQHFAEIEGLRIQFRMRGTGEPLLMLHGWAASSLSFSRVSPALEKRFRILAPDLPGFGFSEGPTDAWGSEDYARVVAGLLDSTGFGATAVLGHSFGGKIGVCLATARPDLVKRLVLVAAPVVRLPPSAGVRARRRAYSLVRAAANFIPPFKPRILHWARMRWGSEDYRNAGQLRPTIVRVLAEDWRGALAHVRCPVQLIYGENDQDVPVAVAHEASRALPPGAELIVVPGAGHFPFLDSPDAFMEAVSEFLSPAEAAADA
jgi:pimeloyl-ACP methyl ester carboxylesterase